MRHAAWVMVLALAGLGTVGGCSDDDGDGDGAGGSGGRQNPEQTGAVCDAPADCYPDVADKSTIKGTVECMPEVRDGYCTHQCVEDTDCCAADGECKTDLLQVCSPFTSTSGKKCFLSCEQGDLVGTTDAEEYCQKEASPDFSCRSSGGGSENRKICMPIDCGVGSACVDNNDCTGGFECDTAFPSGYCGRECTTNAECGNAGRCVQHTNGKNYCFRDCDASDTICSQCRGFERAWNCTDQVTFADATTPAGSRVCVP